MMYQMGMEEEEDSDNESSDNDIILDKVQSYMVYGYDCELSMQDLEKNKVQKRTYLPPSAMPVTMLTPTLNPTPQGVVSMPVEAPSKHQMKQTNDVPV